MLRKADFESDIGDGDDLFRAKRRRHGLDAVQIDSLLALQGGRCAICGTDRPGLANWSIDHDHELAKVHRHPVNVGCRLCVRGIICNGCNTMLGAGRDNPSVLEQGAAYLRRWLGRRA